MVMLPHSLYQISVWMRAATGASNPAAASKAASAVTRSLVPPVGSPTIRRLPKPCRANPGSGVEQVAWTTQPMTCRVGIAAAMRPSGSADASFSPS